MFQIETDAIPIDQSIDNHKKFYVWLSIFISSIIIIFPFIVKVYVIYKIYKKDGYHSAVTRHALYNRCDFMMNPRFDQIGIVKSLIKKVTNTITKLKPEQVLNPVTAEQIYLSFLSSILLDKQELYRSCKFEIGVSHLKSLDNNTIVLGSLRPSTGISYTAKTLKGKAVITTCDKIEKTNDMWKEYKKWTKTLFKIRNITNRWIIKMEDAPATKHIYQMENGKNVKERYDISKCELIIDKNIFLPTFGHKALSKIFNNNMYQTDVFINFESYILGSILLMPWSLVKTSSISKIDEENIMECIKPYGDWMTDNLKILFKKPINSNNKIDNKVSIIISVEYPDSIKNLIKPSDDVTLYSNLTTDEANKFECTITFEKDYIGVHQIFFNHVKCMNYKNDLYLSTKKMVLTVKEHGILTQEGDDYEIEEEKTIPVCKNSNKDRIDEIIIEDKEYIKAEKACNNQKQNVIIKKTPSNHKQIKDRYSATKIMLPKHVTLGTVNADGKEDSISEIMKFFIRDIEYL